MDGTGEHEAELRTAVRAGPGPCVLTGGQTGVDTWAAQAALAAGLPVHLIFPAAYRQEDGPLSAARRRRLRGATLHELSSASFRYRTWTSVYLSDAVVLLDPAGGDGCRETAQAAHRLSRPLLTPDPGPLSVVRVTAWLAEAAAQVVLVAGCRASILALAGEAAGVRAQIADLMAAVARLDHAPAPRAAGGLSWERAQGAPGPRKG